ncbi:Transcription initiation factor TFIID subunit 14 [Hibiscus syriacus]|uniref:Transcription initiation factor TFIID subunit 14 n=1 Tax=Hibiscus syriacus TaxID=106335 RepID=A0A6A2ZS79_HIBSY|nr:Transcription initiation factor TFIID subunit 14 [Hibiscus syriacus]
MSHTATEAQVEDGGSASKPLRIIKLGKTIDDSDKKLYPEDESGPQSTKKPVVMESYNEIVFPDPSECFFARVQNHPAVIVPRLPAVGFSLPAPAPVEIMNDKGRGDTKDHPLSQWYMNFSEADELLKLASARQQVQAHIVKLRRELSVIDGMSQPLKPASSYECT